MTQPESPPAFPTKRWECLPMMTDQEPCKLEVTYPGMSLRDWFAGQALASFSSPYRGPTGDAEKAYRIADAMLAERAKGGEA